MRARPAGHVRRDVVAIAAGLALFVACSSGSSAPLQRGAGETEDAPAERGADAAPADATAAQADAASDAGPLPDARAEAGAPVEAGAFGCQDDPSFPGSISVPEASAATEVELSPGVRELLVVADSGHAGTALLLPLPSGTPRAITLALDAAASDDLEGVAWRGGKLYTLTSSGAVRRFTPDGAGGLVRDQDAYPLGAAPTHACADLGQVNCGRNYEGLCLRADSLDSPCAGYAASRGDGKLYCLTLDQNGVLAASTSRAPLDTGLGADRLSDCAFGTAGGVAERALIVASNVYDFSRSYRLDEASGTKQQLPTAFLLNLEAVAVDAEGALYTFSDDNQNAPSPGNRLRCQNW